MARKLIAITACATGVAHTYMAEKALLKAATGIGNKLTAKDVQIGEAVIFATDTKVRDADRFDGKKILQVNVSDPIKDAEKVINSALDAADKG